MDLNSKLKWQRRAVLENNLLFSYRFPPSFKFAFRIDFPATGRRNDSEPITI